jgi:chaperonin GroES
MDTQEMPIAKLLRFASLPNLADELEENQLVQIGKDVVRWTTIDEDSNSDWYAASEHAMDLALQVVEEKDHPWEGASNVKYPLITVAALQFHARSYPAVVQGNQIVKAKTTGRDQDGQKAAQAERVAAYMNYQLIEEQPDWDEQMDKLLLALPIEGVEFKKTYFDPGLGRNCSEWIRPQDFIVNAKTKSLDTCPRQTHRLYFYPQEIHERIALGVWSDVDLNIGATDTEDEVQQEFYEQHSLLDLDEDGYKEPYCITVHVDSGKVVRIKADFYPEDITFSIDRQPVPKEQLQQLFQAMQMGMVDPESVKVAKIDKITYFTKFSFIPSPDGSFYDIGFGQLVGPLSETINSTINQMIDAGTLANLSGGFVREGVSVSGRRGSVLFSMGEFKQIKVPGNTPIAEALYQMRFDGPSAVLFNLLGFLVQGVKDITGVQDIFTGGQEQNETATTTMARIEQGSKVFSAIYKRVYRSLTQEFHKIFRLNGIYLQPETYFRVLDDDSQGVVTLQDFRDDGTNVKPVSDPTVSTTMQKVAKAEALMALKGDPGINADEINRRFLEAIEVPNYEALIVPEDKRQAPPDPKVLELELKSIELENENKERMAQIRLLHAKAIEAIASAEAKEAGTQLDAYRAQLDAIMAIVDAKQQREAMNGQGRTEGMEGRPGDQGGAEAPPSLPSGMPIGIGGIDQPGTPGLGGGGMPVELPQGPVRPY